MPDSQQPQKGIDIMVNFFKHNNNLRVLDIGAGMGKWSKLVRHYAQSIHAVEAHLPYIERFKLHTLYDKVYNEDIRKFICEENYDVAILGDVLEHLEYDEALEVIDALKDKIPRLLLTIPITICIQDGSAYGNDFETHRYQWSDKEIQEVLGFKLLNVGANDNGLVGIGTYMWG